LYLFSMLFIQRTAGEERATIHKAK